MSDGREPTYYGVDAGGTVEIYHPENGQLVGEKEAYGRQVGGDAHHASVEFEIRPYEGHQLYVDGKPVGEPFR